MLVAEHLADRFQRYAPCESVTVVENVCLASWIVGLNDNPA